MSFFATTLLKIRRAETPFYARLKRLIKAILVLELPTPRFTFPFWRMVDYIRWLVPFLVQRLCVLLYRKPIFISHCAQVGKRLYLEQVPCLYGNLKLVLGDDVNISGAFSVGAGRTFDQAEVILGDKVFIGHQVIMQVAQRIEIEEGVLIAADCYITDNDSHPVAPHLRRTDEPVSETQVRPVHIGRYAWVGRGSYVMKGVTIGEYSVVGAGSMVVSEIPPYCIAVGNPARVIKQLPLPEEWNSGGQGGE